VVGPGEVVSKPTKLRAPEVERESSWIYDTINRKANLEAMKEYEDTNYEESTDFAKEGLELTDSQEQEVPSLKETSPGLAESGAARSVEETSSEESPQSAAAHDGSLANSSDCVETKTDTVHDETVGAKSASSEATAANTNGSDSDSTTSNPKQVHLMNSEVARTEEDLTLGASGGDLLPERESHPASELAGDSKACPTSTKSVLTEIKEHHYDFEDYCMLELTNNDSSNGDIRQKEQTEDNLPGVRAQDEHIYEFDDESDEGDAQEGGRSNECEAGNPMLSGQDRLKGRRYEEIPDDIALKRRPRDRSIADSESSDSAIKAVDVEETESKSSSMTVTLDLSHIDKEDPLYSSAGDNRLSSERSSSVEVGSSMVMARGGGDTQSTESSEEAGRDGMVTPVEITYNESMFNLVREKLEGTPGHTSANLDQTKSDICQAGGYDDDDAMSNDSAEYSSLPDEDDNLIANTRAAIEAHKKSKDWLTKTMERPALVGH